jgi:TolB-like protein/DNA-binding SARP family transcriptional activator
MYRLRTLGGAALLRDSGPIDSLGPQRKLLALLALLAVAGRRGISRDRIAALLWSESDMERARGSLKQSLHVLRRQFGTPDVVVGSTELRLNTELVTSDVEEFLAAAETGDNPRVVQLYGGAFLDGFHLPGAAEFEQWAEEQRAVLARRYAQSLEALAHGAHHQGAFTEAAALWRQLQAQDPFSTRAVVGLMEALDAAGERSAALRAGQAWNTLVREELGTPPDPAVASLMQRLRMTAAAAPASHVPPAESTGATPDLPAVPAAPRPDQDLGAPTAGSSARPWPTNGAASRAAARDAHAPRRPWLLPVAATLLLAALGAAALWQLTRRSGVDTDNPDAASIAVIPFVNTSDNAADGHFADGLTDELISTLGRVEGMRVSARTSTFALKDRGLSARAFADTLGVAAVIEGTVRRQADRLKITAQLVDPADNSVLWAESYDRQVQDIIAVQEEIARAIVRALQGRLPSQASSTATAIRPDVDAEVLDLYLRGRYNWDLPLRERLQQAARYHQRAVERDPTFAPAYAALAETYVNLAIYAHLPADEALARADLAAERALALDGDLVEALAARTYVRLSRLDFAGAETDLRRALAVNPNYSWAHHFFSLYLMMAGRPGEAEVHNRQALLLDPLSLPANATRGIIQAQLGNLAAAEHELTQALVLRSDFTLTLYYLGVVHAARGSYDVALQALRDAARDAPHYPGLPGAIAFVLHRLGRSADTVGDLAALEQRAGTESRARVNLAFAHAALGRTDDAIALLDDVQWDVPALIGFRADPLLQALRSDPRGVRLLRTLGAQRSTRDDHGLTPR